MNIWDLIKHFSKDANWGDPSKMDGCLLITMDAIREYCNIPIVINCGYATSGHAPHSYHYKGMACDWHFASDKVEDMPFSEQIKLVVQALRDLQFDNFVGFGVYPYWHHPGFHLDVRGYKARWVRDKNNQYLLWHSLDDLITRYIPASEKPIV